MATGSRSEADASDFTVLIVDTETTDLLATGGELIEIAAVLYSVKHRCVLSQISTLLPTRTGLNRAVKINQIPVAAALTVNTRSAGAACGIILDWGKECKYVIAHNAEFDRSFVRRHAKLAPLCEKTWLCTCYDFDWPRQHRPGMNLVHLALAHGIGVTCAHRALSDCQLISSLFSVLEDDLMAAIVRAARPKCRVVAKVEYTEKDKAREAGFKWEPTTRHWSRWVAIEDLPLLPVRYTVSEVDPRGNDSIIWARLWQMYVSHKSEAEGTSDAGSYEDLGRKVWRMVREVPAMKNAAQTLWGHSRDGSVEPDGLLETMGALEMWFWTAHNQAGGSCVGNHWEGNPEFDFADDTGSGRFMVRNFALEFSDPSDSVETDATEEKALRDSCSASPAGDDDKSIGDLADQVSVLSVASEKSSTKQTERRPQQGPRVAAVRKPVFKGNRLQ
ncbi:hypothetical protein BSKO_04473 [Bryopsis sp. KO-2023]|nr:hypothetical protein BSKO_04473 [Bryopsis sp. KO-2023]